MEIKFKDLVGKTILSISERQHSSCDDTGYLDIEFTDGTKICVVGDFSDYTGDSSGEFPTQIYLREYGFEHESKR